MRPKSPNYYQKNIMVKRILLSIVLLLVIAYLVVAVTAFNRKPTSQVCQDVELVIKDTVYAGFITKKEVATLLEKKGISPVGKDLERVRTKTLERELAKHPLIDQVECYKTPSGKLCIEVTQRIPILRVMSANGENYYLDNKGTVMPPDAKCVAHLAVVTGNVEKSFAMRDLYKFGVFLQKNSFWKMCIRDRIQEQNSYAGVTNKLLAQKACKICVAYEGMEKFFPAEKIIMTGNPVRQNPVSYTHLALTLR